MTPEQATALILAITGLLVAIGTVLGQVRGLRREVREHTQSVDGRMSELLVMGQLAARRLGELEGRDYVSRPHNAQDGH